MYIFLGLAKAYYLYIIETFKPNIGVYRYLTRKLQIRKNE